MPVIEISFTSPGKYINVGCDQLFGNLFVRSTRSYMCIKSCRRSMNDGRGDHQSGFQSLISGQLKDRFYP